MLSEKVTSLHTNFASMKQALAGITIITPVGKAIEKACMELKALLESPESASMDAEIKTALVSVYGILERADNGLKDESVKALFPINA